MKKTVIVIYAFLASMLSCDKPDEILSPRNPVEIEHDTLSTGWSQQKIADELLLDIFFQDSLIGYTGGDSMYKTNNGGNTWIKISAFGGVGNLFITPDSALNLINNAVSHVKKFTNWAQNSSSAPLNGYSTHNGDLYFTSNNNGFLITDRAFFATTDGGSKWNQINSTGLAFNNPSTYSGLSFIDSVTGWVFNGTNIFKTNGTNTNWIACNVSGSQSVSLSSIQAVSRNIIYVGGYAGVILKSLDGGINFSQIAQLATVSGDKYTDIHFFDVSNGYACNNNRIYQTKDGGVTWNKVVGLVESQIIEIHFIDVNHGWACTVDGRVLRYVQ